MAALKSNWTFGDVLHWFTSAFDAAASDAETNERIGHQSRLSILHGLRVIDRRDDVRGPKDRRGRPRAPRRWDQISGVTIHQSASGHLDSHHPRILSIPAHIVVHRDGSVTLLHPLPLRMPHAHALNSETIGIEVDCRDYGVEDDPRTFWRSKRERKAGKRPQQLEVRSTATQLKSLERVLDYCEAVLADHGRPCKVFTHRQGHWSRVNDPGQRISQVVDAWAQSRGIEVPYNETRGSGKPWRHEWRA